MEPQQLFRVIRRRWRLIVVLAVVGAGLGIASASVGEDAGPLPVPVTRYEACHVLLVDTAIPSNVEQWDVRNLAQLAERLTQGEIPSDVARSTGTTSSDVEEESERILDGTLDPRISWPEARTRARPRLWRRYCQNAFHRVTGLKLRPKLLGGNCSVHRLDLERVNGFDERFVGWGLEDDDLLRRLRRIRVRVRDGSLDCLVLHLFHPIHESHAPSVHHTRNYGYYHRGSFLTRCRRGLRDRPLEDVSLEFAAALPPALHELPGRLGRPRKGERAEVLLLAPGQTRPAGRAGDCDVVLTLGKDVMGAEDPIGAALRFLEEEL